MARISRIVFAGLLALAGASAHAGYAQLAPPPGFAPMPTASPARWGYAKAANEAWVNQTVRVNASLNVGGQAIKVPVTMRLAANAPRIAAAAIYAHPGLRAAIGIASLLSAAKVMWDESKQEWVKSTEGEDILPGFYEYRFDASQAWTRSGQSACDALKGRWTPPPGYSISMEFDASFSGCWRVIGSDRQKYNMERRDAPCPSGWETTPAGCRLKSASTTPLTTPEEFIPAVINPANNPGWPTDFPMPSTVPDELPPGTPLPVEQPVINPSPGTNPQPQPYFVPQGDPVPNPNYDPNAAPSPQNQPYIIPGVRIVPSPTADEPWRVDVQPVHRPTPTKDPLTPDELNPQPDPNADPNTQPDPGADDKPKPEEQQSLCEKHPEILACQKLDKVQPTELAKEDININISPVAGWGSDSAACPAPRAVVVAGKSVEISWQPVCDFASGLRPLVIALAWLSAVSMVIVVARRN